MNHHKIAALLLGTALFVTGCSGLTLAGNANGTTPGTGATEAAQNTTTSVTAPLQTTPQTIPQTKPPTAEEILVEEWAGRIYPGIQISGFKIGGLTFKEAEDKMEEGRKVALTREISYRIDGVEGAITQEELGVWFDYESALEEAKNKWRDLTAEEQADIILAEEPEVESLTAEMTYDEAKVEELTEELTAEVSREVTPAKYGRSLDREAFQAALVDSIRFSLKTPSPLELPVNTITLRLDKDDRSTIAKSYSWFDEGTENRSFNVKRAAESLDGTVINPGEIFSFNETVGAASKNNGYKAATVYSGNGMDEGYGGGVCQVSSTLYNAIINAGLPLVERHTHGYTVNYLPKGMDATIYYPSLDLKFRNPFAYPIIIRSSAEDGDLSFRLVSHEDVMEGYTYEFSTKLIFEDDEEWESIVTDKLSPGKVSIVYYPHPAAEVDVYRTTYKDGKKVDTEYFDTVTYRTLKGRKQVGK